MKTVFGCLLLMLSLSADCLAQSQETVSGLGFNDAVERALVRDPVVAKFRSRASRFNELGEASAQLPDPLIKFGAMNVPVDSFALDQEGMTQSIIGFQQMFPSGKLRRQKRELMEDKGAVFSVMAELQTLELMKQVQMAWLDAYHESQAQAIVHESQKVFLQLTKITQYQYRAGRGNQQDVVQAQLEYSLLQDRETAIATAKEVQLAQLARLVGIKQIDSVDLEHFPVFEQVADWETLERRLELHPMLQVAQREENAAQSAIDVARAGYYPNLMLDVTYGRRDAMPADVASVMFSVSVPMYGFSKQASEVAAARHEMEEARQDREDRYRNLHAQLRSEFAKWNKLRERSAVYKKTILPQSEQSADASVNAYQSGVTDFNALLRARLVALESQLKALRIQVDEAKSVVVLEYIAAKGG